MGGGPQVTAPMPRDGVQESEIIRVFPERTKWTPSDPLAFVGEPPLSIFRPDDLSMPVHVSAIFTWQRKEAERLRNAWDHFYQDVGVGGPAYGDPGGEFEPGRYIKPGVTITSRGCPRRCSWCFVPEREGGIRELEIKPGWIIQDNNLLACSREHVERVFAMLQGQGRGAIFSGGLDARLLQSWHIDLLRGIRLAEAWLACDTPAAQPSLQRASELLAGIPERKKRCYVLIGWQDEDTDQAERRLEEVYAMGFLPFAQLYRGPNRAAWSPEWRALARKWSRPAAYRRPSAEFHRREEELRHVGGR